MREIIEKRFEKAISKKFVEKQAYYAVAALGITFTPLCAFFGYSTSHLIKPDAQNVSELVYGLQNAGQIIGYASAIVSAGLGIVGLRDGLKKGKEIKEIRERSIEDVLDVQVYGYNQYAKITRGLLGFLQYKSDNEYVLKGNRESFIERNKNSEEFLEGQFRTLRNIYKKALQVNKKFPEKDFDVIRNDLRETYSELRKDFKQLYEVDAR